MKLAIAHEHRRFFEKNGWIEFDDLLSSEQLSLINLAIDQTLADRLEILPDRLKGYSSEQLFFKGHDLWRSNSTLEKLTLSPRFGEIASELVGKKPLRIGSDQLFPTPNSFGVEDLHTYSTLINREESLESMNCLTDLVCGLMLSLKDSPEETEESGDKESIFPHKAGAGVFFLSSRPVSWQPLKWLQSQRYYLIVYTRLSAHYVLQTADPHTHFLKQLGCVFNDKLNDRLHPIVYR